MIHLSLDYLALRRRGRRGRDRMAVGFTTTCAISAYHPVSSSNKTDRHDIAEILLKVALNTIKPNQTSRCEPQALDTISITKIPHR